MPIEQVRALPARGWHEGSKPPMATWLSQEQSKEDKARLKALGNIVQPSVGFWALQVLARRQLNTLPH